MISKRLALLQALIAFGVLLANLGVIASNSAAAPNEANAKIDLWVRQLEKSKKFYGPDSRDYLIQVRITCDFLKKYNTGVTRAICDESARLEKQKDEAIEALVGDQSKALERSADDDAVLTKLGERAWSAYDVKDWDNAWRYAWRGIRLVYERMKSELDLGHLRKSNGSYPEVEIEEDIIGQMSSTKHFCVSLINAAWNAYLDSDSPVRLLDGSSKSEKLILDVAFQASQWLVFDTDARAAMQMQSRLNASTDEVRKKISARQRLTHRFFRLYNSDWQSLSDWKTFPKPKRNETEENKELEQIQKSVRKLNGEIQEADPEYFTRLLPKAVPLRELQGLLNSNEAFIEFLDVGTPIFAPSYVQPALKFNSFERGAPPEQIFAWVITKDQARWIKIEPTEPGLILSDMRFEIKQLRCGLLEDEWQYSQSAAECAERLNVAVPAPESPAPFNLQVAYNVYRVLFGQVEELIKDKELLIVPSEQLARLPLQVLVTAHPTTEFPKTYDGYRNIPWLAREHAITILPSAMSFRDLRSIKKTHAPKPYIGFGDPVLIGRKGCEAAPAFSVCPSEERRIVAQAEPVEKARRSRLRGGRSRNNSKDRVAAKTTVAAPKIDTVLAEVRSQCPLPDSASEIRCVAQALHVPDIKLREAASERLIKASSASGELADYRVVHFATHGVLKGEISNLKEPALILTPPAQPADTDDDGLLTASEITELDLNADWVILSACNTLLVDEIGTEPLTPLSTLSSAFFYAGARSVLISHWPVYSRAAVKLITAAFSEIERDKAISHAEALRRSMVALMDDPQEVENAHPAVWAPFALVGAGGK